MSRGGAKFFGHIMQGGGSKILDFSFNPEEKNEGKYIKSFA